MSSTNECLEFIIGLSQTDCPCFDADKPVNADRSDSGLYLGNMDDIPLELVDAAGNEDCEPGNIWEIMSEARHKGVVETKMLLMQSITSLAKLSRQPWSGVVGDIRKNKWGKDYAAAQSRNFASFSWICTRSVSGFVRLRKIGLVFKTAGTFTVELYSNYQDAALGSWSVTSSANAISWFTLPTPLELTMAHSDVEYVQYWLVYDTTAAPIPKDVKISCGCGVTVPDWSPVSPTFYNCYYSGKRIGENWPEFIMARGQGGNVIADRMVDWITTEETNGLAIWADFGCRADEIICKDELDYSGNILAGMLAHAVLYRSAYIMCRMILASPEINRFTMMDREALYGKRNHYEKECKDLVAWLAKELTKQEVINNVSDCLQCQDPHGFNLGLIMS